MSGAEPLLACIRRRWLVAVGGRTTLNELHRLLCGALLTSGAKGDVGPPVYRDFRAGDVRHLQAEIGKAPRPGYAPTREVCSGLAEAVNRGVTRCGCHCG